jgi:hypothetical protein
MIYLTASVCIMCHSRGDFSAMNHKLNNFLPPKLAISPTRCACLCSLSTEGETESYEKGTFFLCFFVRHIDTTMADMRGRYVMPLLEHQSFVRAKVNVEAVETTGECT